MARKSFIVLVFFELGCYWSQKMLLLYGKWIAWIILKTSMFEFPRSSLVILSLFILQSKVVDLIKSTFFVMSCWIFSFTLKYVIMKLKCSIKPVSIWPRNDNVADSHEQLHQPPTDPWINNCLDLLIGPIGEIGQSPTGISQQVWITAEQKTGQHRQAWRHLQEQKTAINIKCVEHVNEIYV